MKSYHVQDTSAILSMHEMIVMRCEVFPIVQPILLHSAHILSISPFLPIVQARDLTHPTQQISRGREMKRNFYLWERRRMQDKPKKFPMHFFFFVTGFPLIIKSLFSYVGTVIVLVYTQKAFLTLPWVWIPTCAPSFGSDHNPIELGLWVWPESQFGISPRTENWNPRVSNELGFWWVEIWTMSSGHVNLTALK